MIKENKKKVILILLALLLAFGWFYWFQYRPSQIKHDCSWVKKHSDAIPERPAQTIYDISKTKLQELEKKGVIGQCPLSGTKLKGFLQEWLDRAPCRDRNDKIIKDLKIMMPSIPAKTWWVKATKEQYQFCLHDKGL